MASTVVNLRDVRELLGGWDELRSQLASGRYDGFYVALRRPGGDETAFLGGYFQQDPAEAIKSVMRASWDLTVDDAEDAKQAPSRQSR